MEKINKILISGLRGVRNKVDLSLEGKSALLYGDNGSGKSTFSDVFEWFYNDKVDHLSGEEIGRKGYEAIRNICLKDDDPASLELELTSDAYNCIKNIEVKKDNYKVHHSNESNDFLTYLNASKHENLILRYKELATFVLASKSDKLRALSEIIGYSKITDTKDTLRKVFNRLSKEIKTKGFDNSINYQQSKIIEQFEQNVTSDKQFLQIVDELVKPFNLGVKIETLKDVNEILKKIKKPDDSKEINQETFLTNIGEALVNIPNNLDELETQYKKYHSIFTIFVSDLEKLKKLTIEKLLTVGKDVLLDKKYLDDNCPLCLENQDRQKLLSQIKIRLAELAEIKKEQTELIEAKNNLQHQISSILRPLELLLINNQIKDSANADLKRNIETLVNSIKKYSEALNIELEEKSILPDKKYLLIDRNLIKDIQEECQVQLDSIKKARKNDPKWDAYGKINLAAHAYAEIRKLRKEKEVYESQRDTMEEVYRKFLQKQKEALETFLETFSVQINEIYQFLNPGEKVENIKLIPLEKDDELSGITIQFDFLEQKDVSPPHRFLSESHLNCLGIAFFLTSVDAFNKQNKFIILDDIISSFDANHRKRFADLLIEKYNDYQVILLTHEKVWFDIVKNLVRGKSWHIKTIKYNEIKGTHLDEAPQTLRERIEKKIEDRNDDGLGNDARKYLEYILKQIANNLEVKVAFKFNNVNEDRMAFELLTELKSTIKKRKCNELKSQPTISRLLGSLYIGNKDSHDSSTIPTFEDMKAFWQDVIDFESLFFCASCGSPVSVKYLDQNNKKITCRKGEIKYTWKP